jgi:integrase/recombinase XerD
MTDELAKTDQTMLPAAQEGGLVEALAGLPEEEVWLAGLRSPQTRRAYRLDVRHFVATLGIRSAAELRQVDRAAVIFWREAMERDKVKASTIRRRLSALSSLFTHLVDHRAVDRNPVRDVKRPRINRRTGKTASFSRKQARAILDAPDPESLQGIRDRAILSVGLQVGPRRAEIAHLAVKDFHQNQGFWSLRFLLKGGAENAVSINPQTAQRIIEYLEVAGHRDDRDGPLFRPVRGNQKVDDPERHLHPDQIDRLLRRYVKEVLETEHGFSAHSMRATFITTALDNGAPLEDVQRDVGHADPSTTKLYDRRGHNPEKSASFFANY